jgi:predicted ATP-grasp superfamily ATP-dependent carboligase
LSECKDILQQEKLYGALLICSNDKAAKWIDDNEDWLSKYYQTPMRGKHIGSIFNKPQQCQLAIEYGICVPSSFVYQRGSEFQLSVSYPILLKPANSNDGEKSDIHICQNAIELKQALMAQSFCSTFIVQEYIEKEFEINLIGVATENGVVIPGGIKKLRHYPNQYSPCSYGIFLSTADLAIDTKPMEKMIEDIGYLGPFSIEFLRKGEKSYFMEVNFRHDGLAYVATASGVNLLEMYLDGKPNKYTVKPTFMMDLSTDYCHVKDGNVAFVTWLKDFKKTGCQLNFNRHDARPTIYYYLSKFGLI